MLPKEKGKGGRRNFEPYTPKGHLRGKPTPCRGGEEKKKDISAAKGGGRYLLPRALVKLRRKRKELPSVPETLSEDSPSEERGRNFHRPKTAGSRVLWGEPSLISTGEEGKRFFHFFRR